MPALTEETQLARTSQAFDVLRLVSQGLTIQEACDEVGISERQYRYWLRRGDDTISAFKEILTEVEKESLHEIIMARRTALERITGVISGSTRLIDLIAADQHLHRLQEELENKYGAQGHADNLAKEIVLSGPRTAVQESRLPSSTTVNIKALPDGSVDVKVFPPDEVVDVEYPLESSQDSM